MATPFSTPNEPSSLQGVSYHHGDDKTCIDNNVDICGNTNTNTLISVFTRDRGCIRLFNESPNFYR